MKTHSWKELKEKSLSPARLAKVEKAVTEGIRDIITMNLADLRKSVGITQAELAQAADMSQGDLSKAERRSDHLVSSLRRVVHGLGGELRITAVFGDRVVELEDV